MIQRIQSLLLAGVAILLTVNLFVPIWTNTTGNFPVELTAFSINLKVPEIYAGLLPNAKTVYYIGGLISICIGLAIFIIFKYNNRPLQLLLCNLLILFTLGILGTYFIAIPVAKEMMNNKSAGNYGIGYFLPIVSSLLVMVAKHFIKKDETLVKSVDRLR